MNAGMLVFFPKERLVKLYPASGWCGTAGTSSKTEKLEADIIAS